MEIEISGLKITGYALWAASDLLLPFTVFAYLHKKYTARVLPFIVGFISLHLLSIFRGLFNAALVSPLEDYGMRLLTSIVIGANIDAIAAAGNIGISADRAVRYKSDKRGTKLNFAAMGNAICSMRCDITPGSEWKEEIEADVAARGE